MHPHLNQPVSKSQNSEITEFLKKKNVQILTFIFYHSGGKKDVLTFHLGILEKKVITPVVFTCPSFFIRQCVAYTL